jgi:tryptophanyl-tRNA synthetase
MLKQVFPLRAVAAVQPTERLHLGNYFGALSQSLLYQDIAPRSNFCFIADYHAQASTSNWDRIQERTRSLAIDFLALGFRPGTTHIYRQSDIPEIMEITWLLSLVTRHSMLERGHRVREENHPSAAVYLYPLLMAADILGIRATHVPVGDDQKQHLDRARDIAGRVNRTIGKDLIPIPKGVATRFPRVPGTDALDPKYVGGVRPKMSKTADNFIPVFCTDEDTEECVARIVTRSIKYGQPIDLEDDTVYLLLRLVMRDLELQTIEEEMRTGKIGYEGAKKQLSQAINDFFRNARTARAEWEPRVDDIEDILRSGAAMVRTEIVATLEVLRECTGLKAYRRFAKR